VRTVVWTGSRGWQDEDIIIDVIVGMKKPFRSIVGDAEGWDELVWAALSAFSLPRWQFKARWQQNGVYVKAAGHQRNRLMLTWLQNLDSSGYVIAGWDGKSTGTKGCMDEAAKRGIDVWRVSTGGT
jgi:hypothetical protein